MTVTVRFALEGNGEVAGHRYTSMRFIEIPCPVIDCRTMADFMGHEWLFRMANGSFLLHLSSEGTDEAEERIVRLGARQAII
jgi:hypothetical protein